MKGWGCLNKVFPTRKHEKKSVLSGEREVRESDALLYPLPCGSMSENSGPSRMSPAQQYFGLERNEAFSHGLKRHGVNMCSHDQCRDFVII